MQKMKLSNNVRSYNCSLKTKFKAHRVQSFVEEQKVGIQIVKFFSAMREIDFLSN